MNRTIETVWVLALVTLAAYELFAVATGRETLSQSIWKAERTPYGLAMALVMGILLAHFIGKTKAAAIAGLVGLVIGFLYFQF